MLIVFIPDFCAEAWQFTQSDGKYDYVLLCPVVAPGHYPGICPLSYWPLAFWFLLACIDPLLLSGMQSKHAKNAGRRKSEKWPLELPVDR